MDDVEKIRLSEVAALLAQQVLSGNPKLSPADLSLIEEVVLLCINEKFNLEIQEIRKRISKLAGCTLPVAGRDFEVTLQQVRSRCWNEYHEGIVALVRKHSLLPLFYFPMLQDVLDFNTLLSWLPKKIRLTREQTADFAQKFLEVRSGEKLTNNPSILDSIIISNAPTPQPADLTWMLRAASLHTLVNEEKIVEVNAEDFLPTIAIHFPLLSTESEMVAFIKKRYRSINALRAGILKRPKIRPYPKRSLASALLAHLLEEAGLSYSTATGEADELLFPNEIKVTKIKTTKLAVRRLRQASRKRFV